jgi:hypothetical protein
MYECRKDAIVLGTDYVDNMDFVSTTGNLCGSFGLITTSNEFKLDKGTEDVLNSMHKQIHYYTKFNRATLTRLHILTLPPIKDKSGIGLFFALLDYILDLNIDYKICYSAGGYNPKANLIIDETNRDIKTVLVEGYRGNRLDLMVGSYNIALKTAYGTVDLMYHRNNTESSYVNCNNLLRFIGKVHNKEYIDVCFEKG